MASRRLLKKEVGYTMESLLTECIIYSMYIPQANTSKLEDITTDILNSYSTFISRISHTEPGNVKGFYKKLREDFSTQVDGIVTAIGQLK